MLSLTPGRRKCEGSVSPTKGQHARVEIQGVPTEGVVDTGADITIIGGDLFKRVAAVARLKKRDLKKPDRVLKTYDQRPFALDGRMELDISFSDTTVRTPVYIKMDSPTPLLLSEGVCCQLGIIMYHPDVQPARKKSLQAPAGKWTITASRPPDQLKQPRTAQQEEQPAQRGEAEPTQPRGEQPAQEPPTQPAQPEKGRHQYMRAIQMGGAWTLYCYNTQPAEGGQGREVCVEQTTDQERDQPAYGAIMATDQPMSSGEGLTAYYPQTQGELQPVLGGFTSKGSQDGVGVSSCRTPGRPQDDTSPREADAKPRKTDRQTIPPPNQLREQPELYCRAVIEKTTITGHRVSIQIPN